MAHMICARHISQAHPILCGVRRFQALIATASSMRCGPAAPQPPRVTSQMTRTAETFGDGSLACGCTTVGRAPQCGQGSSSVMRALQPVEVKQAAAAVYALHHERRIGRRAFAGAHEVVETERAEDSAETAGRNHALTTRSRLAPQRAQYNICRSRRPRSV